MIPVCYQAHPFDYAPHSFRVEPGVTLLEIVQKVTKQPEVFVLSINGQLIDQEWWPRIRPRIPKIGGPPLIINFHPRPKSDTVKSVLAVVAAVAVIAAATFVAGPAGTAFFTPIVGASLAGAAAAAAGAAVGIAGALAISALTAPPVAGNIAAAAPGVEQQQVAGVSINSINPGDYLSMVLGTMRASPHPLQPFYTTLVDGEIFVHGTVGLAGAYDIQDIWLNGAPAEEFADFTYSVRQGLPNDSAPDTNFTYSVNEQQPRLKMSQTKRTANTAQIDASPVAEGLSDYHVFHVPPPGDDGKVVIRLHWPGGMNSVQPDNDVLAGGIGFRVEIKPSSSTAWYKLPELHFHQNAVHGAEIRQQITLQWQSAITTGTFSVNNDETAWVAYAVAVSGQPYEYIASAEYDPGGAAILAKGVTNDDDGFTIEIDNTIMNGDDEYDVRIKMGHSYTEGQLSTSTYQYVGSAATANQLWGGTGISGNTTASKSVSPGEFVYLEAISSWIVQEPFDWHGLASISFSAKGLEIQSLSALFTSMVPIWDGVAWTPALHPSNNPAALYRFVCTTQDFNAQPIQAPVLDEGNMVECWEECITQGYTCNAVIQNQSVPEVLQMIASTMFGAPRFVDTWGCLLDRDRSNDDIIQMLTPLNSKDLGTVKAFPRLPHAIRAQYLNDEDSNAFRDDVVAFAPGYDSDTARVYESITYQGFTDANLVARRAQFDINQLYMRSIRYVRDVHMEGLITPRGSLIGLVDEVVEHVHRYSMLLEPITDGGNVTGLRLESRLDLNTLAEDQAYMSPTDAEAGAINQLAVTVRLNDGSPSTHFITETSASNEVTFVTPVADTGQFEHSQIVAIGIAGREYKRCLVMNVEPHQGGELMRLYLADERPELYV